MDQLHVLSRLLQLAALTAGVCLSVRSASAQDFNSDGVDDTVIGVPYEGVADAGDRGRVSLEAGAVGVVYGTSTAGATPHSQHWTLASDGIPGSPQAGDHFGFAVAWGRFNNDSYWDLAIGIPGRDVDGIADAGSVLIIHGSKDGLVASGRALAADRRPRMARRHRR